MTTSATTMTASASLVLSARTWWNKAVCVAHLAALALRSWLRSLTGRGPCTGAHGPKAYRIYVFNEGDSPGFHHEVAPHMFSPDAWGQDVRKMTSYTDFRVEIRYIFRHKKYRMVLRPGDECEFPPYQEPSAPACRLPKGVLSARLQGPVGSNIDCDVTARVLKYQGPRGDFHTGLGLRVRLQDMFPFDDQSDNSARFSHLRLLDTMARVHDLPYEANPSLVSRANKADRGA